MCFCVCVSGRVSTGARVCVYSVYMILAYVELTRAMVNGDVQTGTVNRRTRATYCHTPLEAAAIGIAYHERSHALYGSIALCEA